MTEENNTAAEAAAEETKAEIETTPAAPTDTKSFTDVELQLLWSERGKALASAGVTPGVIVETIRQELADAAAAANVPAAEPEFTAPPKEPLLVEFGTTIKYRDDSGRVVPAMVTHVYEDRAVDLQAFYRQHICAVEHVFIYE